MYRRQFEDLSDALANAYMTYEVMRKFTNDWYAPHGYLRELEIRNRINQLDRILSEIIWC